MDTQPPMPAPVVPTPAPMMPPPAAMPAAPKKGGYGVLITVIVILVLVIAYGVYAFYAPLWPFSSTTAPYASPTPTASATADWKTYTNTAFGFQLTFTEQWSGYTVTQEQVSGTGQSAGIAWTSIAFSVSDQGVIYTPIYVLVFTRSDWQKHLQQGGASLVVLGQNDVFVFAGGSAQYPPTDPKLKDIGTGILASFKLTTASPTAGWKTYTNTQYGFSLTLNDAWQGYKTIEQANTSFGGNTIWFEIPTSDPVWVGSQLAHYVGVFAVNVMTPAQYAAYANSCANSPCEPAKLGQNSSWVFSYSGTTQDVPHDWNAAIAPTQVLATFKLTQ